VGPRGKYLSRAIPSRTAGSVVEQRTINGAALMRMPDGS
jgi:hypothetical protein